MVFLHLIYIYMQYSLLASVDSRSITNERTNERLIDRWMAMSTSCRESQSRPHIGLLPSAGMGHIAPFCRLAAALSSRGCIVSFMSAQPTVSSAESLRIDNLISAFPSSIRSVPLPLAPLDPLLFPSDSDPFYLRYEAIRRSSHLLSPLITASSPPLSALVVDIGLSSAAIPVANSLNLPCFVLFTTSAAMLSFYAYFPTYLSSSKTHNSSSGSSIIGDINVPGLWTVPRESVLPGLHNPDNFFTTQVVTNSLSFPKADGILINTFEQLEADTLAALNARRVTPDLPPVLAIGPLQPFKSEGGSGDGECTTDHPVLQWLDGQPQRSVVYVSFGSRTAMSPEQIRELGEGLEKSRCRFLWVIKTKKVDRQEEETETAKAHQLRQVLGEGYVERVKDRGMVVNGWVEQEEVLGHRAVGGFLSHGGWNSMVEAMWFGVPVMAWPRGADQRINGEVLKRSKAGVWMENWSWEAEEDEVVRADEIAKGVKEMMEDQSLKERAESLRKEARMAVQQSDKLWEEFIQRL